MLPLRDAPMGVGGLISLVPARLVKKNLANTMAVNTQPSPGVEKPLSLPLQEGCRSICVWGPLGRGSKMHIVKSSLCTLHEQVLVWWVLAEPVNGGGCTQIRGDSFPHFLSVGIPAKGERRFPS